MPDNKILLINLIFDKSKFSLVKKRIFIVADFYRGTPERYRRCKRVTDRGRDRETDAFVR